MKLRRTQKFIPTVKELGCGLLTVLFVTLPLWAMSVASRGPVFAFGALVVLLALVIGVALLHRLFDEG